MRTASFRFPEDGQSENSHNLTGKSDVVPTLVGHDSVDTRHIVGAVKGPDAGAAEDHVKSDDWIFPAPVGKACFDL